MKSMTPTQKRIVDLLVSVDPNCTHFMDQKGEVHIDYRKCGDGVVNIIGRRGGGTNDYYKDNELVKTEYV